MSQHTPTPPSFFRNLLTWWSSRADIEDLIGDMDEEFAYRAENESLLKARLFYIYQTFSLIFSYAVKRRKASAAYSDYYSANTGAMIMSYVKISVRNFSKHKLFTLVNVVGLALGMSVCLLALSIAVAIYQTDEWHERKADIYQINTFIEDQDGTRTFASTFPTIADKLTADYPFVEEAVAVRSEFSPAFLVNGSSISFDGYYASRAFFEIFDFPLLQGDPGTVLRDPNSIVLSQSVAYTLFRDEDPIGKMLETADGAFQVTGVMADPRSTHLYFDFLASASTYTQQADQTSTQQWGPFMDNYVYIRVRPNTPQASMKEALAQVAALAEEYHPDTSIELQATNLGDVVPQWNVSNNIGIGWDLPSLYFFFSIGLLILVPAIFNYTNLSIARALKRSKEIGIRKVVGAGTGQVKTQFIVETMVLTFIALLGSVLIYLPVKEQFLDMIYAAEVMDTSMGWIQLSVFLIFCLLVGWFAGLFPARFFASLNPVYTLKGQLSGQKVSVSGIKKGLFIFQFFVSLVFIIGVGAIAKQYAYVLNNNHGFNSDNVLVVPFERMDKQVAINELRAHPDVKAVTTAGQLPGVPLSNEVKVLPNTQDTLEVNQVYIGEEFVEQLGMTLVWGSATQLNESNQNEEKVLVNQSFLKSMSVFKQQGDSLQFTLADGTQCRIVGITEDFNYEPLDRLIRPLIFRQSLPHSQYALLTVNSSNIQHTLSELETIWHTIDANVHFEATFLDDEIEKAYSFIRAQIKIFSYLSVLAISISCLGLLGMVSYTTENRTKEIAIRKIMGATMNSLYFLLTKDFIRLIGISAMIAIPFSYLFYDKLFLYFLIRYGPGLGIQEVVVSIIFLFAVGFASIFWQTSKVASSNPSENLRYE